MVQITIDPELKTICPQAVLGLLECDVRVGQADEEFLRLMDEKIAELAETELSQANKREQIQLTRKGYKALGKDPNRYRCSAEAMCRRIAKERGLEPLAELILLQMTKEPVEKLARAYVSEEKGVADIKEAIAGARDILAEQISDNAQYRTYIRKATMDQGMIRSGAKDGEAQSVYEMYYDYEEPVKQIGRAHV